MTLPTFVMHRRIVGAAFFLLLIGAGALPAEAQLRVCNQASETISIALAYRESAQQGGELVSRGWFVTKAGECSTVVDGPLRNRYYYIRGNGTAGSTWGGSARFCTTNDRFRYVGASACEASGFRAENFAEVDTGDATVWTYNLMPPTTAPSVPPDSGRDTARELRVGWRTSALDVTTKVMRIFNDRSLPVGLQLKCYTTAGGSKWLAVTVPANGVAEVGFVEGWPGNFVSGEHCDAFYGTERVWTATVS